MKLLDINLQSYAGFLQVHVMVETISSQICLIAFHQRFLLFKTARIYHSAEFVTCLLVIRGGGGG